MSFDESKIIRDDHGRFSGGGLGGFAAKHSGKIEGYSAPPRGDMRDWVKAKLGGRAREIEVPLIRKTEEHVASTGQRPITEISGVHADDNGRMTMASPLDVMIQKASSTAQKDRTTVGYASAKEDKAGEKITDDMRKTGKEIKRLESELAAVPTNAVAARLGETPEAQTKEIQSKIDTLKKKDAKLDKKMGEHVVRMQDHDVKMENAEQIKRAAEMANTTKATINSVLLEHLRAQNAGTVVDEASRNSRLERSAANYNAMKKESSVEVSHGHDDSFEFHIQGQSHDDNYPGEKSLNIRIEPAKVGRDKHGDADIQESARMIISSQYPTDRRGKDHPAHGDEEFNYDKQGRDVVNKDFTAALKKHAENFFKS